MRLSRIDKIDGLVKKTFINVFEESRYKNELKVLKHLNQLNCNFVPKLHSWSDEEHSITMEDCGATFNPSMSDFNMIRHDLKCFSVVHYDLRKENLVTKNGMIYVIDFESCKII